MQYVQSIYVFVLRVYIYTPRTETKASIIVFSMQKQNVSRDNRITGC